MFYDWYEKLNAHSFIEFLKKLIQSLDLSKKYVFILDNAPAHRAKMTQEFINGISKNIFIEYLPPYSPQLNCIETSWKIIRHEVTSSNFYKEIELLKKGVEQFLNENDFRLNPNNYLTR
jgi:transposase